jgi:hypothetical protein
MSDIQYINGLIVKAPNERAPEYVKAKLSIKRAELIEWLQGQSGDWINADVKVSQGGKWYCAVDTWKPNSGQSDRPAQRQESKREPSYGDRATGGFEDDAIPFAPIPRRQLW